MPMTLGANANTLGAHVGEWRHPDAWPIPVTNLQNAMSHTQIAERPPELQRRGLFRTRYEGHNLRQDLGLRPVPNRFFAQQKDTAE